MIIARLMYTGCTTLGRPEVEVMLMPLGELLDQREIHWLTLHPEDEEQQVYIDQIPFPD